MGNDRKRNLGQFYTPTLFVDYAHDMISKEFGEDWKEKYVVWDNSAASKQLTRDYYFKELYSSTLEQAELDISKHYNKEAVSFQFDFLNDSLDKLPKGLIEAFEQNKPIIFFMNPPYVGNGNMKQNKGTDKSKGIKDTMVSKEMKNFGKSSNNLYAQFIYRIMMIKEQYNLTDIHIALFCPTLFLTGRGWKIFRSEFLTEFAFSGGVQFKASHFADVADNWGISFSIWKNGETTDKNNFDYKLIDNTDGEIEVVGSKVVYNIDDQTISGREWVKEKVKNEELFDTLPLKSALNIGEGKGTKLSKNALGCYVNESNNIDKNTQFVCLLTSGFNHVSTPTITITNNNFGEVVSMFSARRLVSCDWINWADEYMKPNTEHEKWQEFENDSIIYSLFESKSNQSSLRNIDYKGKKWDIKNEFFFMSKEDMLGLSEEFSNDDCYNDARVSKERYVYELLEGIELSEEAQAVLDKAREIVRKTFKYRKLFNEEHENYQINNWDASYYQMKPLWKEYAKEDFEQFKVLYKKLADKMRPMVYELGFLKR